MNFLAQLKDFFGFPKTEHRFGPGNFFMVKSIFRIYVV